MARRRSRVTSLKPPMVAGGFPTQTKPPYLGIITIGPYLGYACIYRATGGTALIDATKSTEASKRCHDARLNIVPLLPLHHRHLTSFHPIRAGSIDEHGIFVYSRSILVSYRYVASGADTFRCTS